MDVIKEGKKVFDSEIKALLDTRNSLDKTFALIVKVISSCKGKLIISGIGKPGHIAKKLSATFSSLGVPSFFLHPAEAVHGDLGMISKDDIVMVISWSGESDEIIKMIPNIKMIGCKIIGITGNVKSSLAKLSDYLQVLPQFKEAVEVGLAPTSSTTAELCYGDALAVAVSKTIGFNNEGFGKLHPAGSLGKRLLLHVQDVLIPFNETNVIHNKNATIKDCLIEMSKHVLPIITCVEKNKIIGIITDGDIRRLLAGDYDINKTHFYNVCTRTPTIIKSTCMAIDALRIMKEKGYTSMPVINEKNNYVGLVTLQKLVQTGLVL